MLTYDRKAANELEAAFERAVADAFTGQANPDALTFTVSLRGELEARGLVLVKRTEIDAALGSLADAFGEMEAWKAR
jgi:hypothetical protein